MLRLLEGRSGRLASISMVAPMNTIRRRTKAEIDLLEQLGLLRQFYPKPGGKAWLERELERCQQFEAQAKLKAQRGRLVDRYGHEHSEAIFENWTPAAIRALGIHRVDDADHGEQADHWCSSIDSQPTDKE